MFAKSGALPTKSELVQLIKDCFEAEVMKKETLYDKQVLEDDWMQNVAQPEDPESPKKSWQFVKSELRGTQKRAAEMAMDIAELAGSGIEGQGRCRAGAKRPWNTEPFGPKADRTKITRVCNVKVRDSGLAEAKRTQRRKVRKLQQMWKMGSQEQ